MDASAPPASITSARPVCSVGPPSVKTSWKGAPQCQRSVCLGAPNVNRSWKGAASVRNGARNSRPSELKRGPPVSRFVGLSTAGKHHVRAPCLCFGGPQCQLFGGPQYQKKLERGSQW